MTEDKGEPKPKGSLVSLSGRILAALPTSIANLGMNAPSQSSTYVTPAQASTGSVAIAGDNAGSIVNINVGHLSVAVVSQIARELPSYLSKVVAKFSEDVSEYDSGPKRSLPPEVNVKLAYNDFPPSHHIIADYSKYLNVLEASYRGVEQRNDDARRLVRRRAAVAYAHQLQVMCTNQNIKHSLAHAFAREHSVSLVMAVVAALLTDFAAENVPHVMQETAHLAVCLIVADAVIECDVLERPADAVTS